MRRGILAAALLALAGPATGATLQQDYEAAATALSAGDSAGAVRRFEALLARLPKAALANPKYTTAAVVRAGLAQAILAQGDAAKAIELFEPALPNLPARTPEERQNLAQGLMAVARAYELRADYPAARAAIERALALQANPADHPATLSAQIAMIRVSIFDAPDVALRLSDTVMPLAEAHYQHAGSEKAKLRRDGLGELQSLRGRIHLNRGEFRLARDWFERALRTAGGLSTKVSVSDTRIRGDLAIVHHLLGDDAKVQRYLAYTGAGQDETNIERGADVPLPACGEATGIRPDDMTIVEFAIGSSGRVVAAVPIYATRPEVAAEFVRTVADWSWQPEEAKKLDPFWRSAVRLELRCDAAPSRRPLSAMLWPAVEKWKSSDGIAIAPVIMAAADVVSGLRAELTARTARHGDGAMQLLPVLSALASRVLDRKESLALAERASRIAWSTDVPDEVRAATDLELVDRASASLGDPGKYRAVRRQYLAPLLDRLRAAGKGDTRIGALLRMELASTYGADDQSPPQLLYRDVVALPTSVLSDGDPIRQSALLQMATLAAARRDSAEAARLVAATGLSPDQCALADVRPLQISGRMTSDDFPNEALRWGFNGWVVMTYDIDTQGRPFAPRTVMAYPPFVFGSSTAKAIERFRFHPLPRPGASIGCTGRTQLVRYLTP